MVVTGGRCHAVSLPQKKNERGLHISFGSTYSYVGLGIFSFGSGIVKLVPYFHPALIPSPSTMINSDYL